MHKSHLRTLFKGTTDLNRTSKCEQLGLKMFLLPFSLNFIRGLGNPPFQRNRDSLTCHECLARQKYFKQTR